MGWLTEHLESFVYPVTRRIDLSVFPPFFKPEEKTIIKNIWRSTKKEAKGKKILLPGRDVFIFEVLARRENYPTLFIPECSRLTVEYCKVKLPYEPILLLDTGFVGSIPLLLNITEYKLVSHARNLIIHATQDLTQVFPRLTWSRKLALKIESSPKYWNRGFICNDTILQDRAELHEFERAAALTVEIYKDSSAKFVTGHKPLEREENVYAD